jgi:hypothetical protein
MQRDIKATRRDLLKAMAAWTAAATHTGCSNNSWLRQLAQSGFQEAQHRVGAICVRGHGILATPLHHFLSDLTPNDAVGGSAPGFKVVLIPRCRQNGHNIAMESKYRQL